MYRRGRPGRDRSRDPSRPFPQREFDRSDRSYRREERHPAHWEDYDRRGGGRDDRSSHLPPHPPLPLTVSGPPSGPAGHPPDQLQNYPRDPSSKGPHSRRDSRDSISRDTLPSLDTTRRHSGGTSTRKEFAEPSPRERGMIGDPQVGPPRRQISGSNRREEETPRSDTRRNSIDRNGLSRSPVESFNPQSPATSITATPTTANSTTNFGSALMAPSAPMHPATAGSKDQTQYALTFQEASSAYTKYLEAQSTLKTAEKERNDNAEHFNAFPAMKERYEGNARVAEKEFILARDTLKQKSAPLELLCRELFKERISQQDSEEAIKYVNKLKKELGDSVSLTQFVKSNTTPQVQGPSKDEFQQLRNELREMKRKQDEEEKMRQKFTNEFHNYKNEQANRFRNHDKKLGDIEGIHEKLKTEVDHIKDEHRKTAEELKEAMELLMSMKSNMAKIQEANSQLAKGGGDVVMADTGNDVGALGVKMDEVYKNLETLQKSVMANQQKLIQTTSRCNSSEGEIKSLQQKVSSLEISGVSLSGKAQEDRGATGSSLTPEEYATKADVLRLEGQIRGQDDLLDSLRHGAEKDTQTVLEVVGNLEERTENHIQTTAERFQSLEQGMNERVTNILSLQEDAKNAHAAGIKDVDRKFLANFANFHNKFQADVEKFDNRVGYVESQLEGHILAISHVDQRMNSFTTKDFYERVVQELLRINPLLFNYTSQLNSFCNDMKTVKDAVRSLGGQVKLAEQRLTQANLSPRLVQDAPPANDGPANGSLKSDRSSEGPAPSFSTVLSDIEALRGKVEGVEKELAKHIDAYVAKMSDIKDWTASATQRLAEGTEDIKELKTYLNSIGPLPGNSVLLQNSADRWRAVNANNQDAMQGLPEENVNGNGNG